MSLLTKENSLLLWHDVVKHAEYRCSIKLKEELEAYLVSLLVRYTNNPEVARQIVATAFLEAMQKHKHQRDTSLQCVGDQCLIFAGLFPKVAEKRHVKIGYFVNLGRSAYAAISGKANDFFGSLSLQFVAMMDVLQSIPESSSLMPLEAYEQWEEVGSQRALKIFKAIQIAFLSGNLNNYTSELHRTGVPVPASSVEFIA